MSLIQENKSQVQKVFTFNAGSVKKSKSSFMAILPLPVLISGVPVWLNNHDVFEKLAEVGQEGMEGHIDFKPPQFCVSLFSYFVSAEPHHSER